jgi:hypothetical protein
MTQPSREPTVGEGRCPERYDGTHCRCWWDDSGPCCACGDDTPSEKTRTPGTRRGIVSEPARGRTVPRLVCLCGGEVLSLDEAPDLSVYVDAYGLYCVEDDEVLTEQEVWMVRGLTTPVHDLPEGMDRWTTFDSMDALIADLEADDA